MTLKGLIDINQQLCFDNNNNNSKKEKQPNNNNSNSNNDIFIPVCYM